MDGYFLVTMRQIITLMVGKISHPLFFEVLTLYCEVA